MPKLLPNLPIENLTPENDYIGIIEKGALLKSFFLNNKHEFSQIKIFSIYGEWGSGKSTLMKYLGKELKGSFNTFFFESWEFESDNNLANSLLEYLTKETNSKKEELLKNGSKLLEGFAKSVVFKTPIVNFSPKEIINEVDKVTFLDRKENFKVDFIKWENKITKGDKFPKYNIVFIDDLDRCEPENILNLLSAMKLFFTYGKKTIFLCGIDKKAIKEAVKNKYGDVVKSNEYLEKVFDVSFSMPENVDASKLVNFYFSKDEKIGKENLGDLIYDFFKELHFKNPRRIKKILNKYLIIKTLKGTEESENLILPNIIYNDKGSLFETYLTLYLLILNEFEPIIFKLLFNFSSKRANYNESLGKSFTTPMELKKASNILLYYFDEKVIYKKIKEFSVVDIVYLSSLFAPNEVNIIKENALRSEELFINEFNVLNRNYEYYFTIFIFQNKKLLNNLESNFTVLDYKKMISNLI